MEPTSELTLVTAEMAQRWLTDCNYDRQRKIAPWQVERLAIEIRRGRFLAGTQIHFGRLGESLKLVNGQHTLAAIARTGIATALTVLITPVEGEKELGELYGRHDRHRSRTPHDAFTGMDMAHKLGLGERQTNAFGSGLRFVLNDFRRIAVYHDVEIATSLDFLAEKMIEWGPVARKYFDAISPATATVKHKLERAPLVAVGLATMRESDKAEMFWRGAAMDDGLRRNDPRKSLLNLLISKTSAIGDPIVYVKHVVAAWNAFVEGRSPTIIRPVDIGKIGVTIAETSFQAELPYQRRGKEAAPALVEPQEALV